MLHLAQVKKQGLSGDPKLRLIARQESGHTWALMAQAEEIPLTAADDWSHDLLVLVEVSPNRQILSIKDAADWVVDLVKNYLSAGITPVFLQQEKERLEQGLQSLTLQKLELSRQMMEVQARIEYLQEQESRVQELEVRLKQPSALNEVEGEKLERLAEKWGISASEVLSRMINEYNDS